MENNLQKKISVVQVELTRESSEQQSLKKQLADIQKNIKNKVSALKKAKQSRDSLTSEVQKLKGVRKQVSASVKEKITDAKDIKPSGNIAKLRQEIKKIESNIETTVMSHEKEKELMRILKEKKKQFNDLKKKTQLSDNINKEKKKADDVHEEMQEKAIKSQEQHEQLISVSKDLDKLRKKQKELRSIFKEKTSIVKKFNDQLQKMLLEIGEKNLKKQQKKQSIAKERLKTKLEEVEDKIKKGEKLTTEDLIVMQGKK